MISVFQRKRPRGDWMNVKMTGMAGESPVGFIKGEALAVTVRFSGLYVYASSLFSTRY
jgi:hypothetical protein